jgi:small conductance mechanosensitive channel
MDLWNSVINVITDFTLDKVIRLVGAVVILIIGFKLIKWIIKIIKKGRIYKSFDPTIQNVIKIIVDYTLKIILIITVASILGVPMTSMFAVLGSAGLAIGLALQGSLSNIAGSFIIFVFKPFVVGDYIVAGDHSGNVQDISLFYTTILTDDNKRTLIPNSIVSNQTITDVSSMPTRRVDFDFSTAYDMDIDKVKSILLETAAAHALVLKNPAPFAYLGKNSDISLIFTLRVWCINADYWTVSVNLTENVKKAFNKNGIVIPFPQLDIHLDR